MRKWLIGYSVVVLLVFVAGYHVLGVRELGLYFFMWFLNLPASLVTFDASRWLATLFGWHAGDLEHVWTLELMSIALNLAAFVVSERS